MATEKKVRRKKIKSRTPRKYKITLSDRIWIKDLPPTKIEIIESGFKEGEYLPFYKSSGTSVITTRKRIKISRFENFIFSSYITLSFLNYITKSVQHLEATASSGGFQHIC